MAPLTSTPTLLTPTPLKEVSNLLFSPISLEAYGLSLAALDEILADSLIFATADENLPLQQQQQHQQQNLVEAASGSSSSRPTTLQFADPQNLQKRITVLSPEDFHRILWNMKEEIPSVPSVKTCDDEIRNIEKLFLTATSTEEKNKKNETRQGQFPNASQSSCDNRPIHRKMSALVSDGQDDISTSDDDMDEMPKPLLVVELRDHNPSNKRMRFLCA